MVDEEEKRIYNHVTGTHYKIHKHSSKYGTKGQIEGLWPRKKKFKYPLCGAKD